LQDNLFEAAFPSWPLSNPPASYLLIDLRLGISDGQLEVPVTVVAPLIEEGIHLLGPVTKLSFYAGL
jgi:hypothetical protein